MGTLISLGLFAVLNGLLHNLISGFEKGESRWKRRYQNFIGTVESERVPGIIWVHFITTLVTWLSLIAALLFVWKVPGSYIQNIVSHINEGITIGSYDIRLTHIFTAILTLAVLLTINRSFGKLIEKRWLTRTRMDRGARESMVTIINYIGIAIALLVSLSVAGVDFSNLAFIAGALSLGVGFGLQNIVNNFISGLILLFERPVKTGDWINVAGVEGYVRKISIRSTQIQTFDRADVIVPNSELISGTFTNFMLHDLRGRIRVPISVAYGSDTGLVKRLLLEVAEKHHEVIKNEIIVPLPVVLFLSFGDSALEFELHCHINNIDMRRTVTSDLNFSIDAIFREHHIEIPFPQRDIHIRQTTLPGEPSKIEIPGGE